MALTRFQGLFTILLTILATTTGKNKTIHLLSLLPYPDVEQCNPFFRDGPGISFALDIAKSQINSQDEILPDYRIELLHDDSGCECTNKLPVGFVRSAYYRLRIVGIIGPACSDDTLVLAPLTNNKNISLVNVHGAGTPLLSNRALYKYALGSLGSTEGFVTLAISLMQRSNWTRVGLLFDSDSRSFFATTAHLFDRTIEASHNNLSIGYMSPALNIQLSLTQIFEKGIRAIFLFTPTVTTQQILCSAYHRGMVYPLYQWIVGDAFVSIVRSIDGCSEEDMKKAVEGAIFFYYSLSSMNTTLPTTYSKLSFLEYFLLLRKNIAEHNMNISGPDVTLSFWASVYYDSLWAWAVALHNLTRKNPDLDLTNIEYGDVHLADMILEEFYHLDFQGVSGRIKYQEDSGFVTRVILLFQAINGSDQRVGYAEGEELRIGDLCSVPDRFPDQPFSVSEIAVTLCIIFTLLQLVVLTVFHVLTIKFRSYTSVKASSFKLNQLVFIGCYFFGLTILIYAVEALDKFDIQTAEVMCNLIWVWMLPISATLTFGPVVAKTWRVYRIFKHYLNPGRFIGEHYLMTFVFILLIVDIIVSTACTIAAPLSLTISSYSRSEGVTTFDITVRGCFEIPDNFLILGLLFGRVIILIGVVLLLAFLTRSIRNPSFTTKALLVLVYLFSATMIVGYIVFFLFLFNTPWSEVPDISLMITLNIMLLLIITLIIFPPLLPLFRDKFFPKLKWYQSDNDILMSTASRLSSFSLFSRK